MHIWNFVQEILVEYSVLGSRVHWWHLIQFSYNITTENQTLPFKMYWSSLLYQLSREAEEVGYRSVISNWFTWFWRLRSPHSHCLQPQDPGDVGMNSSPCLKAWAQENWWVWDPVPTDKRRLVPAQCEEKTSGWCPPKLGRATFYSPNSNANLI